ncbi:MAG: hypothetical protein APF76_03160 [Desulfitibacter sp. BRH_c19]|nr:MAG: hypothetical protein APF76_03160 [Desulfitibacter sp. BRH_c19]
MKVAFPLMGHLHIGLEACFDVLETDYHINKPITKRTIELGTKYSPEFACLPFKINVGNFIEALEEGADTLIFAGGFGPCRFGYYGQTQFVILKNLGFKFDYLIVEMVEKNQQDLLNKLRLISNSKNILQVLYAVHFGYSKLKLIDKAEKFALYCRPRELSRGSTCRIFEEVTDKVKGARSYKDLIMIHSKMQKWFQKIQVDKNKKPMKIGLVGEIYSLLEPNINLNLEKKLGHLGIELVKSIYISDWVKEKIFLDALGYKNHEYLENFASPYINRDIGGHCFENVAKANMFIASNCNGIIHMAPLTCMPEIVAKGILNRSTEDKEIPFISIFIDEQSGDAGLQTRLEAFVDLLESSLP